MHSLHKESKYERMKEKKVVHSPLNTFLKVPCYVFDSDGKKHDLNPLIKLSDGYLVDDPDVESDFYINICRSLSEFMSKSFYYIYP